MAKDPKPRIGSYLCKRIVNVEFSDGTWIEGEEFAYPKGGFTRRAYVTCPDGIKRVVICSIPDSFFSIPARVRIGRLRLTGFITTFTTNGQGLKFTQSHQKKEKS